MSVAESLTGRHKTELRTPALLLDVDKAERNIRRMAEFFAHRPCKVRPHTKTHKLAWIAGKQVEAGAVGATCAKLQEAEAFAQSGINHILIANEVIGREKIAALAALAGTTDVAVCAENYHNACDLSEAARAAGLTLDVLIEVDVGLGRCGVLLPVRAVLPGPAGLRGGALPRRSRRERENLRGAQQSAHRNQGPARGRRLPRRTGLCRRYQHISAHRHGGGDHGGAPRVVRHDGRPQSGIRR
jgi:hypothetical protein